MLNVIRQDEGAVSERQVLYDVELVDELAPSFGLLPRRDCGSVAVSAWED